MCLKGGRLPGHQGQVIRTGRWGGLGGTSAQQCKGSLWRPLRVCSGGPQRGAEEGCAGLMVAGGWCLLLDAWPRDGRRGPTGEGVLDTVRDRGVQGGVGPQEGLQGVGQMEAEG